MLIKLIGTVFEVEVTVLSATGADNSSWGQLGRVGAAGAAGGGGEL